MPPPAPPRRPQRRAGDADGRVPAGLIAVPWSRPGGPGGSDGQRHDGSCTPPRGAPWSPRPDRGRCVRRPSGVTTSVRCRRAPGGPAGTCVLSTRGPRRTFDERAGGAAPDRSDDGLPVEFDGGAGQCGGPSRGVARGVADRVVPSAGDLPLPKGAAGAGVGRSGFGSWYRCQPFTAPVRPPTMRFSKTEKKTSAGSMASEVKARTFAVSVEYCEENTWTPSGRV